MEIDLEKNTPAEKKSIIEYHIIDGFKKIIEIYKEIEKKD
jgi:hypothetical protein